VADIFLTNTLTHQKEKFIPINPPNVGMYTCGPTVYLNAHIGHMRKYLMDDILVRVLKANGFQVTQVMNITDVGHLVSDADTGEDKMEKSAKVAGKSVWDLAKFYEKQFFDSTGALNINRPDVVCKATDHIQEQIDLIKRLEEKGFTYKTGDGIYFDTSKFKNYGVLTGGKEGIRPGTRIEMGDKKNPTDFALWKFSPKDEKRQMEWDSPWGTGFPGWHIECSAMSMKYLGEQFDIHTGGEDHIAIHHTNEIAQSEAATGKSPFVRYWLHTAFLTVDGVKMSKSLNNFYTVDDVIKKGFDPLALRYLYLGANYRDSLNFTWDSLAASQNALEKLRSQIAVLKNQNDRTVLSEEKEKKVDDFRREFMEAVNDDLNTAKGLAVLWEMLKSNIPSEDKYDLAISFDDVLGLKLGEASAKVEMPEEIKKLIEMRQALRAEKKFDEADKIRKQIEEAGFEVKDPGVK
jgi:cysteinyl-tRNA synthetase